MVNSVNCWTLLNLEPDGDSSLPTSKKSKLAKIDGLIWFERFLSTNPCPNPWRGTVSFLSAGSRWIKDWHGGLEVIPKMQHLHGGDWKTNENMTKLWRYKTYIFVDMQNGSQQYVNMKNYHEFHLGIRNPIPLNSKSNDLYDRVSVSKKQGCQVLKQSQTTSHSGSCAPNNPATFGSQGNTIRSQVAHSGNSFQKMMHWIKASETLPKHLKNTRT